LSLQQIVEHLAAALERPVTASTPSLYLLAFSPQPAGVDRARIVSILERRPPEGVASWARRLGIDSAPGPVRTELVERLGLTERVVAPIRVRGTLRGYLWVIDPGHTLPDTALETIVDAADAAAGVLEQEDVVRRSARDRERDLVRRVIVGEDAALAARELSGLASIFASPLLAAVVARCPEAPSAPLRIAAPAADRGPRLSAFVPIGGDLVALMPAEDVAAAPGAALADQLAARSGDVLVVGIGEPVALVDCAGSYGQATVAADIATAVPECGPVASWGALGVYRVVWRLAKAGAEPDWIHPRFRALVEAPTKLDLAHTLETFLDLGGDVQATAAALHLHRTTLYHRLQRIESITGAPLRAGQERTGLHLALKLARYGGLLPERPVPAVADRWAPAC